MEMYVFSVDYNIIHSNDILDIHEYLMKVIKYTIMFGSIKKCVLLY